MKISINKSQSFGWNIKTHDYITRKSLEGYDFLSSKEISLLAKYSQEPDLVKEEKVDFSSGHFYDALNIDPSFGTIDDEKNNALSKFLKYSNLAKKAENDNRDSFFKSVGYALHYLQDATTPPHTEHGNYLHKLYRLPMHILFEKGKFVGTTGRLKELDKHYEFEELPFSSLETLLHNNALYSVQAENHVSYNNILKWFEIQQRCVNRSINSSKSFLNYILTYLPKEK